MAWFRYTLRFLAASVACLLVSCIDGREEIWLNADGSGHADVNYTLPAAAARFQGGEAGVRRMLGEFLQNTPAITSSGFEVATEADRLNIHVQGVFKSVRDFKGFASANSLGKLPSSVVNLAGEVKADRHGRTIDFSRTISPGKALPGAVFMPASRFEGRKLIYILHLPQAATESNATRVEDEGRSLVWEFPLSQAIQSPVSTRFKVKIPIPAWLWASAVATISVLGLLAFLGIRKLRRTNRVDHKIEPGP